MAAQGDRPQELLVPLRVSTGTVSLRLGTGASADDPLLSLGGRPVALSPHLNSFSHWAVATSRLSPLPVSVLFAAECETEHGPWVVRLVEKIGGNGAITVEEIPPSLERTLGEAPSVADAFFYSGSLRIVLSDVAVAGADPSRPAEVRAYAMRRHVGAGWSPPIDIGVPTTDTSVPGWSILLKDGRYLAKGHCEFTADNSGSTFNVRVLMDGRSHGSLLVPVSGGYHPSRRWGHAPAYRDEAAIETDGSGDEADARRARRRGARPASRLANPHRPPRNRHHHRRYPGRHGRNVWATAAGPAPREPDSPTGLTPPDHARTHSSSTHGGFSDDDDRSVHSAHSAHSARARGRAEPPVYRPRLEPGRPRVSRVAMMANSQRMMMDELAWEERDNFDEDYGEEPTQDSLPGTAPDNYGN